MSATADRFTCEEVFRRLDDFLDRDLSEDDLRKLEEHLAECEVCASEFRFESSLVEELQVKLNRVKAPDDLRNRLKRAIRSDD